MTEELPRLMLSEVRQEDTVCVAEFTEGEYEKLYQRILIAHADWMSGKIRLEVSQMKQLVEASKWCTVAEVFEYCRQVFTCPYNAIPIDMFSRKQSRAEFKPTWEHFQQCLVKVRMGWRITKTDPSEKRKIYESEYMEKQMDSWKGPESLLSQDLLAAVQQ